MARANRIVPYAALAPMAATVLVAYLGSIVWTVYISMTASRTFPSKVVVGLAQYTRLLDNERWMESVQNIGIYGLLYIAVSMALGFLLAVFIDQNVKGEGVLRTVFLYPYAMSFIATGLVWQWILGPDYVGEADYALYAIVLATVWQSAGLVMVLMLAGLRGVDAEIWKAARLDGIPTWRVYLSIVLPMLGPTIATVFVLLSIAVVKLYDAVVAMTQGGPGTASEVPAKFVMDHLFGRANIALASAAAVMLLVPVVALLVPFFYARWRKGAA